MTPYNQQQNQAIPYMNYGSGAGSNAFQNNLNQNKFNSQQQGLAGQAIGNAAGSIDWSKVGNWFSGGGAQTQGGGTQGMDFSGTGFPG